MQKQKVDSRIIKNAQNVFSQNAVRRQDFNLNAATLSDSQAEAKLDSRNEAQNLKTPAQDSRIFTHNAPIFSDSQAAGFCDDFGGFQGGGEGIYLGDNEQAPAAESHKSAQKPTPKPKE
ncbi:hypothetical protein [Helicobacter canis]|uniref:D-lactate dehydrogenase n=1 Tax=Helicobacter canis TaxID=29419 RepID=A0A377J2Q0_9HELI|nr:hypothetical protein [Helicobacter canis]STO96782.1 D-lactate dehydrogenase [Helicobacter canis]